LLSCYGENKNLKFWLASMKTLTNCKNPSSIPLQIACCDSDAASGKKYPELVSVIIEASRDLKRH
jgi:hypothetical protein